MATDVNGEFPPPFDFVEAAVFMNGVSKRGCKLFDSWKGDVLVPLNESIAILSDHYAGSWEKNFALRVLMHCMCILHCNVEIDESEEDEIFNEGLNYSFDEEKGGILDRISLAGHRLAEMLNKIFR